MRLTILERLENARGNRKKVTALYEQCALAGHLREFEEAWDHLGICGRCFGARQIVIASNGETEPCPACFYRGNRRKAL